MPQCFVPVTVFAALASLLAAVGFAATPWKPEKPVEIVATNAPGGGSDRIIRIMSNVLQERKQVNVPVSIVNKPGGGGMVAYAYLNQHAGDGHYILLGSKSLVVNSIVGRGPSYSEYTSVAHL